MLKPVRFAVAGVMFGVVAVAALVAARAQQPAGSRAPAALTAADIVEIQQLAVRYTYALDSGAWDGEMFAELFAPDAVFTAGGGPISGRERFLQLGRGRSPMTPRRFIVNHVVDPAPEGARGRVYVVEINLPTNAAGGTLTSIGGIYEDSYQKTADGWRFKTRQFVPSKAAVRPAASAANVAKAPPAAPAPANAPVAAAPARTTTAPPPAAGPGVKPLSPADYLAIQDLVSRYGYVTDAEAPDGNGNGRAFAALFTPDGIFEGPGIAPGTGGAALRALATLVPGNDLRRGPNTVVHFSLNHLIEPTADGAVGRVYALLVSFGDNGQPHPIRMGGQYEDVYARTADGWKFKSRRFIRGKADAAATWKWMPSRLPIRPAAQDTGTAAPLTSMDALEIRRLVANYAYGLDGGADDGGVYADNFAPGASLFGRVQTRDEIKALASREPHGPQFTRHFLANVLVEPGTAGPIGRQYLAVIDVSEEGKDSAIYLGGRYEDEYVKTPQGWKFKSRNLTRAAPPAPASK